MLFNIPVAVHAQQDQRNIPDGGSAGPANDQIDVDDVVAVINQLQAAVNELTSNQALDVLLRSKENLHSLIFSDIPGLLANAERFVVSGDRLVKNFDELPETLESLISNIPEKLDGVIEISAKVSHDVETGVNSIQLGITILEATDKINKLVADILKIQQLVNDVVTVSNSGKEISNTINGIFDPIYLEAIKQETLDALAALVDFLQQEVEKLDKLEAFLVNKTLETVLPVVPALVDGSIKLGQLATQVGAGASCDFVANKDKCRADTSKRIKEAEDVLKKFGETTLEPRMQEFAAAILSEKTLNELIIAGLTDLGEMFEALAEALEVKAVRLILTRGETVNGEVTYSYSIEIDEGQARGPSLLNIAQAQSSDNCALVVGGQQLQGCSGEFTIATSGGSNTSLLTPLIPRVFAASGDVDVYAAALDAGTTQAFAAAHKTLNTETDEVTDVDPPGADFDEDEEEDEEPTSTDSDHRACRGANTPELFGGTTEYLTYKMTADVGHTHGGSSYCWWHWTLLDKDNNPLDGDPADKGRFNHSDNLCLDGEFVTPSSGVGAISATDERYYTLKATFTYEPFHADSSSRESCTRDFFVPIRDKSTGGLSESPEIDSGSVGVPINESPYVCKPSNGIGLPIVPCGKAFVIGEDGKREASNCPCQFCHFFQLGSNILRFITVLFVPVMAALFFVWGGFYMLTSGPNPERRRKGTDLILKTLQGVFIVYVAWIIINSVMLFFVNPEVLTGDGVPQVWHQVQCQIEGL